MPKIKLKAVNLPSPEIVGPAFAKFLVESGLLKRIQAASQDIAKDADLSSHCSGDHRYSTSVSDEVWEAIKNWIPTRLPVDDAKVTRVRKPGGGRKPLDQRLVFEELIYILKTNQPLYSSRTTLRCSATTIQSYYKKWLVAGLFTKIWTSGLNEHPDLEGICWKYVTLGDQSDQNRVISWLPVLRSSPDHHR